MIKGFLRLYERGDQLNARLAGVFLWETYT
jgi:hypothetical protein